MIGLKLKDWSKVAILLVLVSVLLAGCGDATSTPAPAIVYTPTPLVIPFATIDPKGSVTVKPNEFESQPAFEMARNDLLKRATLELGDIKLVGYSEEQFNNSGLGCPEAGGRYMQVITPGFIIRLEAKGQTYTYHTDAQGRRAILCGPGNRPLGTLKP